MARQRMMLLALGVVFCATSGGLAGCESSWDKPPEAGGQILRLATTTSAANSGLLDVLIPFFEQKTGLDVEITAVGTGNALAMGREGRADVILVHSRVAENQFVAEGYGLNRRDVMYNDFVLLGPANDPAGIRGDMDVASALRKIAGKKEPFNSRGDNSGTYLKELEFWRLAEIEPQGAWYVKTGKSMLETLRAAALRQAYVLSDRSTYLFHRAELELVVLCQGDQRLWNPYGVIAVNPVRVKGVNYEAAMQFIDFLVSEEGQKMIRNYGLADLGHSLFKPLATPGL
ncbi:MAG: substrate-binding domain-containing protein [Desulfuromonadales bacterium]|nr:substrate-binding domain-containing protein [Desulfuromonadales bacterium]MDW7756718.1 substrate-binding domain-containing protein [Desulfuromonadales bacterium]